ncbi:MAG: MoaD/ThiS family protein [Leptonema sp. (in: bacteria)]
MLTKNKIHLVFFAVLKDILTENLTLEISENVTIQELKELLIAQYPQAKEILKFSRFANESQILAAKDTVKGFETLYVLPPSSGG